MNKKVIAFYMAEKELLWKSDWHLKKIYKNRVEKNLETDREVVVALFDKMWELFFSKKLTKENVDKLLYGFQFIIWKKELNEAIMNHLEFRKANLK